jgi:hypothetical protein
MNAEAIDFLIGDFNGFEPNLGGFLAKLNWDIDKSPLEALEEQVKQIRKPLLGLKTYLSTLRLRFNERVHQ